jgi:hypothetical protein
MSAFTRYRNRCTFMVGAAALTLSVTAPTMATAHGPVRLPVALTGYSAGAITSDVAGNLAGLSGDAAAAASTVPFIDFSDGTIQIAPIGPTLDLLGLGGVQLSALVDFIGLGGHQLGDVLNGLVGGLGLSAVTVSDVVNDLDLSDAQVAPLLTGLVHGMGMDDLTVGQLLDAVGVGDQHLAPLLSSLVDGLGLQNITLNQLPGALGIAHWNLQNLLSSSEPVLKELGLWHLTFGQAVNALGMGNGNIGLLLSDLGASNQLINFFGGIVNVNQALALVGLSNTEIFPGIGGVLNDPRLGNAGLTLVQDLNRLGIGDEKLGDLVQSLNGMVFLHNKTVDDVLGPLGLDHTTIGQLLNAGLIPDSVTVGGLLNSLGLGDNTLGGLLNDLTSSNVLSGIFGQSVDQAMNTLGLGSADLDDLVNGLGIADHYLLTF